ncbi:MAG: nitrate reductase [Marinilabiliales bacterium]|nr:MAG: nitrate reductase [Marinilabiliales bacterium]
MKSRREFIRISALGLGGFALAGGAGMALRTALKNGMPEAAGLTPDLTRTPTYCEVCFWRCAGWVYKDSEGKLWKITGNDDDPLCHGRLCPRGTGGVGMYYDEDRLRTPLMRTVENGKQTYREASWEEALDYIARRLKEIAAEHGPECIALFTHGSGGEYFSTLLQAMGSTSVAAPSYSQCRGPREVAFITTYGQGLESPEITDIRDTRCLVLIGSHLGENMHNTQVQEMSDALEKGATIITVDPRFSVVAGKSKYWLPIKPATDLALLLAWTHVIIAEELYDKEYVERHTYGFEQLRAHVRNFTPEWAYGITTIEPVTIRRTAREMAAASPAVIIHPGRHVTWYGDDTQRLRAVAILNALLGSWGRRGGFFMPDRVQVPHYPRPPFPEPARTWREAFPERYPLADLALASGICEASIPGATPECNFKAWIVNGTNLLMTLPDQEQTKEALRSLDLVVVVDTMPAEITGWADVVLPECTYLERYDIIRNSPARNPNIALRAPATEPLHNTKPAYWMAKELAIRMGFGDYFAWESIEEMLDWQFKELGTSLEEMMRTGVKNYPRNFDDLYFADGQDIEFYTNTGKIELWSTSMEAAGFDPLPVYTPHEEPPEGYYRLNYGRAPMHTFARTANNPNLADLMEENDLWVNPVIARMWGLNTGDYVRLRNQDGIDSTFAIRVRVTERIRWDSVYMVHGFGHADRRLKRAYGRGINDTELMSRVHIDPIMGGTGMRGNFVTFILDDKGKEARS